MRAELLTAFASLPRLDKDHANPGSLACKICGAAAPFFDVVDFQKYASPHPYLYGLSGIRVDWFRCQTCGFLFTPFFDDWTASDFSRFVYNDDYERVDPDYKGPRPARLLEWVPPLLGAPGDLRILDYGSGAGRFVEGLTERGYHAIGYDPFSSPTRPAGQFDLITCFEVIEHSPEPLTALRDMRSLLAERGGILMSQTLQPVNIEETRCAWWYCAPRNGHCSTFTARSLAFAGERAGSLRFHPGGGVHAFTSAASGPVTELLERMTGRALVSTTFGAPAGAEAPGWHHMEQSPEGPFRWTSRDTLTWQSTVSARSQLDILIPVRNVIRRGFLEECRVLVDGQPAETQPGGVGLIARIADFQPAQGSVTVELKTPAPQTPRALRGVPDDRPLGLAIAVL